MNTNTTTTWRIKEIKSIFLLYLWRFFAGLVSSLGGALVLDPGKPAPMEETADIMQSVDEDDDEVCDEYYWKISPILANRDTEHEQKHNIICYNSYSL